MTAYGPKAHLGSAIINWAPYYIKAVRDALEGKWTDRQQTWWGVKEGAIDIVSIADRRAGRHQGQGREDQGRPEGRQLRRSGRARSSTTPARKCWQKDAVADDKFLGGINFYVKGVEGSIPSRSP